MENSFRNMKKWMDILAFYRKMQQQVFLSWLISEQTQQALN